MVGMIPAWECDAYLIKCACTNYNDPNKFPAEIEQLFNIYILLALKSVF